MGSLAERLASFTQETTYDRLPAGVIDKTKGLLLHGLISAIAGFRDEKARRLVELVKTEEALAGGASIIADGQKVTRGAAAFATAELIHRGGRLDVHALLTHPGTVIIPTAIALAETEERSGNELVVAMACGYEVQARLAQGWIPRVQSRGFRSSPIFGLFGATVAAAKLLHLDAAATADALSIAVELASGNLEGARTGSQAVSLHEPFAAKRAIEAGLLARHGVSGSATSFEGPAGFYYSYGNYDFSTESNMVAAVDDSLGDRWDLMETSFRVYPLSGFNQQIVEGAAALAQNHDLDAGEVESVQLTLNPYELYYPSPLFPKSPSVTPGRGSPQYFCAWGLIERGFPIRLGRSELGRLEEFEPAGVLDLAERIEVTADDDHPPFAPRFSVTARGHETIGWAATGREFLFDFQQITSRMADLGSSLPMQEGGYESLVGEVSGLGSSPVDSLVAATIATAGPAQAGM